MMDINNRTKEKNGETERSFLTVTHHKQMNIGEGVRMKKYR
jgi:hypothetical protein